MSAVTSGGIRRRALAVVGGSVLAAIVAGAAPAAAQSIAVQGNHFVVDKGDGQGPRAKFLVFISYPDALRATDLAGDLDYLANTARRGRTG